MMRDSFFIGGGVLFSLFFLIMGDWFVVGSFFLRWRAEGFSRRESDGLQGGAAGGGSTLLNTFLRDGEKGE